MKQIVDETGKRSASFSLALFCRFMASVCDEIRSELKTKALKWCRKYLGGSWKNLSLDEFSIERLGYVFLLRTHTS